MPARGISRKTSRREHAWGRIQMRRARALGRGEEPAATAAAPLISRADNVCDWIGGLTFCFNYYSVPEL